jgi:hypothetical protein
MKHLKLHKHKTDDQRGDPFWGSLITGGLMLALVIGLGLWLR